jgi:hypothetical protein
MTEEKWKSPLEIVGIGAIVASLVLVAYELRQSTAVSITQAIFQSNTSMDSAYRARAQDPVLAQLVINGNANTESLTDLERNQFAAWLRADMNNVEAMWFYFDHGLIPEKDFDGYRASACSRVITDGGRRFWRDEGKYFAARFRVFIDESCIQ